MKNLGKILLSLAFLTFLVVGCSIDPTSSIENQGFTSGDNLSEVEVNLSTNEGIVRFVLPNASKSLDPSWAAANADTYSIYIYKTNSSTVIHGYALSNESTAINIAVPADTYSILVLGGKRFNSSKNDGTVYLLGSYHADSITVNDHEVTTVNAMLNTVSMNVSAPSEVQTGDQYEVTVTIDYGTELISNASSTSIKTTYDEISFSNAINENLSKSHKDGQVYTKVFDVTAPPNTDNGTSYEVWYFGNILQLTTESGIPITTLNKDGLEWADLCEPQNSGYRFDIPNNTTYPLTYSATINLTLQPTEVDVNIDWS